MIPSAVEDLRARMARLAAAIDDLASFDLSTLDHREIGEVTIELQHRVDAQTTRFVGAFDTFGDPGRATTATWLAYTCRIKKARARVEVMRARALRSMPDTADAYAAGRISSEHVHLLAAARRANAKAFAKAEPELLDDATTKRFDQFARSAEYFRQLADPDGVEADAQDAHEQRNLHCSETFENTVRLDGSLDPIGGGIFNNELARLEHELFEADWAEARARLGDQATANDLRRTPEQRRADALVEMAIRSAAMPENAKQARILLTILVGYETFAGRICQLADGTVVTPGQVVSLFPDLPTDIDVERIVFGGPSRVIDVGVRQRLFTGATRRAVQVRDLECDEPTCDVPHERCEIDHIHPYALGGETTQHNGRLRCPNHHDGRRRRRPPPAPDEDHAG